MLEFAHDRLTPYRSVWFAAGAILFLLALTIPVQAQPVLLCPEGPVELCVPSLGEVTFPLAISGSGVVEVEGVEGGAWTSGILRFVANSSGLYELTVRVTEGEMSAECTFSVNVTVGQPPVLICPTAPFLVEVCGPTEVCFALPGVSGTGVISTTLISTPSKDSRSAAASTPIRTDSANCCFLVDTSGVYQIEVVASNACGADTCVMEVLATVGTAPEIVCFPEARKFDMCELTEISFPLEILGVLPEDLEISGPVAATWTGGEFSFLPNDEGIFEFVITAANDCGTATCTLAIAVALTLPPEIVCPIDTFVITGCEPTRACLPLEVLFAESVTVGTTNLSGVAWADDTLCFDASTSGLYTIPVVAANECSSDTCEVLVRVDIGQVPTITCVPDTLEVSTCFSQVCLEIPVQYEFADSLTVAGYGRVLADSLCFTADTSGLYSFTITAHNECGAESCTFLVNVVRLEGAVIKCPPDTLVVRYCGLGEVCVPIAVDNYSEVMVDGAAWSSDTLCFTPSEPGVYTFSVVAVGDCSNDTCDIVVSVVGGNLPEITCTDTIRSVKICGAQEVCVELPVTGEDSVMVDNGARWTGDNFCFDADTVGFYAFNIVAFGECGNDTCYVGVTLVSDQPPVISCPEDTLDFKLCELDSVCIDLSVTGADSVVVDGATWGEGMLCFVADSSGLYHFQVTAYGPCGDDVCDVYARVVIGGLPELCINVEPMGSPRTVQLTNCTDPLGEATFRWDFGDNSGSGEANPVHTYATAGCYTCTLTRISACDSVTLAVEVCVTDEEFVLPTDKWISIYCATPNLEGVPLVPGDVITAYDPDTVLCGMGIVGPDGKLKFTPIYHDDIYTPGFDEGAEVGDTIQFKVNGEWVTVEPPVIWTEMGDRFNVCDFRRYVGDCLTLEFQEGWSLVSWNVAYTDQIENLIAQLGGCVDVVLGFEQGGLTYDPQLVRYSTLKSVDYYSGYWFYMTCATSIQLCGGPIPSDESIPMYSGWNLVSYWPEDSLPVGDGWSSILGDINIAYSYFNGVKIWQPGQDGFNTLNMLQPEFGYWIKSSGDGNLVYPGWNTPTAPYAHTVSSDAMGVTTSRAWISIYGENLTLDGRALVTGSVIEARTADGLMCGKGIYSGDLLKFTTVYGEDNSGTVTKSYPAQGERVLLFVDGVRVYPDVEWSENGARVQLGALRSVSSGVLPGSFSLAQNYPNPFNPSTRINFSLPVSGHVTIDIFNVMGQKIATIADGSFEAGEHSVTWDATDTQGRQVAGGVYLYRLTSDQYVESRKMVLLK